VDFFTNCIHQRLNVFELGTEVEIAVMTGFSAKGDMYIKACHGCKGQSFF
jgi:hypothetical protein